MKNILFIILAGLFSGILGNVDAQTQSLPSFTFYDYGNKAFATSNLKTGVPVIVIYFDPDCDHCNKQAAMIKENIGKFANIQVMWVAFPASQEAIAAFGRKYYAAQYGKNFFFLRDNDYTFDKSFGYSEAPSLYVYNKSGKLVKSYKKNEVSVDELLSHLK